MFGQLLYRYGFKGNLIAFYLALFVFIVQSALCEAQTRNWVSGISGDYSDPTRWSSNQVPDTTAETAEFDIFGIYTVDFSQSVGSSIDQLAITRGDLRFFSSTFGNETLTTENGIEISDADLDLDRKTSFGNVNLASNGALTMSDGAQLKVLKQSIIDVAGIDIEAGTNSQTTEIQLNNNQVSHFGDVVIANRGSGSFEGALNMFTAASGTIGNIDLATTGVANRRGFLQLSGNDVVLTQTAGSVANLGANAAVGEASLLVTTASFHGDTVNVFSNGRINVVSGHFEAATSLMVDGGLYQETNASTRSFGANVNIEFKNNAQATFANQNLVLTSGQTLTVEDSTVSGNMTLDVTSGAVDFSGTSLVELPVDVGAQGSLIANANSTSTFTSSFSQTGTVIASVGSTLIFQEEFLGGTVLGTGKLVFEDTVLPSSISTPLSIAGDAELDATAELEIKLGGTLSNEYDQLAIGNTLTKGGILRVSLVDLGSGLFSPSVGDEFELLSASTFVGNFDDVQLPLITSTQQWQLVQTATDTTLRLVDQGDYNGDGIINAADYTVWRDSLGSSGHHLPADGNGDGSITIDDYNLWVATKSSSSALSQIGQSQATSVPEPASLIILFSATCLLANSYGNRSNK